MCSGEEHVANLLLRLQKRGVDPADLTKLPAYEKIILKRLSVSSKKCIKESDKKKVLDNDNECEVVCNGSIKTRGIVYGFLLGCIAVAFGLVFHYEIHTHQGFAKFWLHWENIDLNAEQCTIDMPAIVQDVFRPPVECNMCREVTNVDRVTSITPQHFEERYAYSGRPVVILDGQRNWTAPATFSFDFFKTIYADDSPVLENSERDCQFFPYQTEFRNLRHVFNMSSDRANMRGEPWYIGWSNCDSSAANILRGHYERPYFLPQSAESSKTDWIFMGTPGYGAHLHVDHVGNPSWQAQIRGRKLWSLEPPPECHFQCVPMEVIVEPGEIIVLDTNIWYHKTLIVSDDLSITIGSEYD